MSDPNDPHRSDERLEAALRERLTATRAPLSPAVEGRLRAARRTALTALEDGSATRGRPAPPHAARRRVAALGGAAIAASVGWLALRGLDSPTGVPDDATPSALVAVDARDWPLLAADEEVDFYEDIEFWVWLDETDADIRG